MDEQSNQNSHLQHRRSIRLKGYDYSLAGAYFISICNHNRGCLFGEIVGAGFTPALNTTGFTPALNTTGFTSAQTVPVRMELNVFGIFARDEWIKLQERYSNIEIDAFQIMPSHIHGIIFLRTGDAQSNVGATLAVAPYTLAVDPPPLRLALHPCGWPSCWKRGRGWNKGRGKPCPYKENFYWRHNRII